MATALVPGFRQATKGRCCASWDCIFLQRASTGGLFLFGNGDGGELAKGNEVVFGVGNADAPQLGSSALMDKGGGGKNVAFFDAFQVIGADLDTADVVVFGVQEEVGGGAAYAFGQGGHSASVQDAVGLMYAGIDGHSGGEVVFSYIGILYVEGFHKGILTGVIAT